MFGKKSCKKPSYYPVSHNYSRNAGISNANHHRRSFHYEGGFFGNIFGETAKSYTCLGKRSAQDNADDILKWRVCTADSGNKMPSGEKLSKCNFIITGECNDPKNLTIDGETYSEAIKIYIKPGLSIVLPINNKTLYSCAI